jgi:phenylacetate-CoA ligase
MAIENTFGCKVFDWYGLGERVVFIGTCKYGTYHVFEDYGYTEFLPLDGTHFEVIGTGFINDAMPLIRYRTGDVVELDDDQPCPCGTSFSKVKAIEGRMDDIVRLRDGTMLGRLNLVYIGLEGIREAQIVQHTYEDFTIRAVLDNEDSSILLNKLRDNFHSRVGNNVRLVIERVPAIERTPAGKFKAVISHVKN